MLLWFVAWLGASLWLGTLSLSSGVAADERVTRLHLTDRFNALCIILQLRMATVAFCAGSTVVFATALAVTNQSRPAWFAGVIYGVLLVLEPVATILAVFHVEHKSAAKWMRTVEQGMVLIIYGIIAAQLASYFPGTLQFTWPVCIVAGYLLGTSGASALLIHALPQEASIEAAGMVAQLVSKWTMAIIAALLLALLATFAAIMIRPIDKSWMVVVLSAGTLPIICLLLLRLTTLHALWKSLIALPLPGVPARRLRARIGRCAWLSRRVVRLCTICCMANALFTLGLAALCLR